MAQQAPLTVESTCDLRCSTAARVTGRSGARCGRKAQQRELAGTNTGLTQNPATNARTTEL